MQVELGADAADKHLRLDVVRGRSLVGPGAGRGGLVVAAECDQRLGAHALHGREQIALAHRLEQLGVALELALGGGVVAGQHLDRARVERRRRAQDAAADVRQHRAGAGVERAGRVEAPAHRLELRPRAQGESLGAVVAAGAGLDLAAALDGGGQQGW